MTKIGGRYALGERISENDSGDVYLAEDERLHRTVQVTVAPIGGAPGASAGTALLASARTRTAQDDPDATAVLDAGNDGDRAFVVTAPVDRIDGRAGAAVAVDPDPTVAFTPIRDDTGVLDLSPPPPLPKRRRTSAMVVAFAAVLLLVAMGVLLPHVAGDLPSSADTSPATTTEVSPTTAATVVEPVTTAPVTAQTPATPRAPEHPQKKQG
jgi:hypothetical protein